jgi:hypothetical protein
LYIPQSNTTIQLKYIPGWFEKLKYKICGFKYTFIRENPAESEMTVADSMIVLESGK